MMEIADFNFCAGDLRTEDRSFGRIDRQPRTVESNVGLDVVDGRPVLCVIKDAATRFRRHQELAVAALRKRKIGKVPVHHEA